MTASPATRATRTRRHIQAVARHRLANHPAVMSEKNAAAPARAVAAAKAATSTARPARGFGRRSAVTGAGAGAVGGAPTSTAGGRPADRGASRSPLALLRNFARRAAALRSFGGVLRRGSGVMLGCNGMTLPSPVLVIESLMRACSCAMLLSLMVNFPIFRERGGRRRSTELATHRQEAIRRAGSE